MTETLLSEDLLVPGPDDPDWRDVVRRATRARRRRLAVTALAVATISCLGVAAAYALDHPIVDFGSAPKGPRKIVSDFGSLQVGAPEGMAPGVLPGEARRIRTVTIDDKEHVLWVAPTKKGRLLRTVVGPVWRLPCRSARRVCRTNRCHVRRLEPRLRRWVLLPECSHSARSRVRRRDGGRRSVRV